MNDETDLKQVFDRAAAAPPTDRLDLDAAISAGRRRRVRRRLAGAASGAVLAAAAVVVAFVVPGLRADPVVADRSAAGGAAEVAVHCAPTGITVSSRQVAAQPSGVVLRVSSSLAAGAYLTYQWNGPHGSRPGGGDPLPSQPETWTLTPPPGTLTLSCWVRDDAAPQAIAEITVTDPGGFWRSTTLDDLGCPGGSQPSWVMPPGTGPTARQAIEELMRHTATIRPDLAARPADVGYLEQQVQVWLVTSSGRPFLTANVTRHGSTFEALPDLRCLP